jgi:hypothetical protein
MAQRKRATRDQHSERLDWVLAKLAQHPLMPAHLLVIEICEQFGIQQRQAYRLRTEAIAKRRAERQQSGDWQVIQEERRQYLTDLREKLEHVLYQAGMEGNRSAELGALRQLRDLDRQLAEVAPLETFRSQLEHQLAVDRMPF